MSLFETLEVQCLNQGFELFGALDLERVDLEPYHRLYQRWIDQGQAGEMAYLERGSARRADPRILFSTAQSMVAVGMPYPATPCGETNPAVGVRYARYLRGEDYHLRIHALLEAALNATRENLNVSFSYKICVDTSALLERTWGALAGLGWIGKNSMLIHPQLGSYFLLGFALLDQKVDRGPTLIKDYCGSCTRCLSACPTQAFIEPRNLDSRKCISYWTLEKRGELDFTPDQTKAIGNWVAGCDICQEVCPFNTKVGKKVEHLPAHDPGLLSKWSDLDFETTEAYSQRVKDSALNRIKPENFQRNLAWAKKNRPL